MNTAGGDWRSALDLLQRLGCGGVVLDDPGRVLARNDVAEKLTSHWNGALPAEVQRIVEGLADAPGKVAWLDKRRLPLILHLISQPPTAAATTRLLVLIDPGQPAKIDETVLRSLFSLTQTEAKLAARLARGERVSAVARARGVAVGTVRSQLRTIFSKTRTKSQAGLVLLLARLTTIQTDT
jgi:DNA-binding CsgD family transcriptional regulator